jgi:hypothetical protein
MNKELDSVRKQLKECDTLAGEEARVILRPICTALNELGVSSVELSYSGCGDDGCIDGTSFSPKTVDVPNELREIVESWTEAVLPEGYEINEGGQGTVVISVADATARIEHEYNVTTTESETYEIG